MAKRIQVPTTAATIPMIIHSATCRTTRPVSVAMGKSARMAIPIDGSLCSVPHRLHSSLIVVEVDNTHLGEEQNGVYERDRRAPKKVGEARDQPVSNKEEADFGGRYIPASLAHDEEHERKQSDKRTEDCTPTQAGVKGSFQGGFLDDDGSVQQS